MTDTSPDLALLPEHLPGRLSRTLLRLWHLRMGVLGGTVILGLVLVALFAPWVAPYDPLTQHILGRLKPPAWMPGGTTEYLLGTDQLGRDLLSRIVFGSRISLLVGVSAVSISVTIGVSLGLVAGYFGGWLDAVVSFFVNVMLSFPFILLALSLVAVLGPSLQNIIIALGLTSWPVFTRVTRVEALKLREREFVLAAIAQGLSALRVIFHHILTNLTAPILVIATVEVARAIIRESLLSFLGLGIQPPTPSWGVMLAEGRDYMLIKWWLAAFPGMAIFLSALGINLLGDALRDLTDPHLRKG
jgi:peptide/nickel transport system permease protein